MEDKIIYSIEKLARVWRFLLWDLGEKEKLTPLQIQILLYLHNPPEFTTITYISQELGITKPTVSGSMYSLVKKKLVIKKISSLDRRKSYCSLTSKGEKLAGRLSSWKNGIKDQLIRFSDIEKQNAMLFLMKLIASLKRTGIINVCRMCITCENFLKNIRPGRKQPHYCKLADEPMSIKELNVDCEKHILCGGF